nr:hypothetical protein [Tanacetum cinerariifolium]
MSSPNYPTSNIEDAFSSPNYTSASPDYSPASPGNTPPESSNNSYGLVPIASPTLSLLHDDPYMKVMHAYDAIIPPQVPILLPTIVPPSPMLSPIFNPQEFFIPKELFPPKKRQVLLRVPHQLHDFFAIPQPTNTTVEEYKESDDEKMKDVYEDEGMNDEDNHDE